MSFVFILQFEKENYTDTSSQPSSFVFFYLHREHPRINPKYTSICNRVDERRSFFFFVCVSVTSAFALTLDFFFYLLIK